MDSIAQKWRCFKLPLSYRVDFTKFCKGVYKITKSIPQYNGLGSFSSLEVVAVNYEKWLTVRVRVFPSHARVG